MPSLIECVLSELEDPRSNIALDPNDLFAQFDLDAVGISMVEGSWEPSIFAGERSCPKVEGLTSDDFHQDGPAIYEVFAADRHYLIVRGREETHYVYFVFEPTV